MITVKRFRKLEGALRAAGYGPMIEWSEHIQPVSTAEEFAGEAIYVICNSGMKNSVAAPIAVRCLAALAAGASVRTVFGHPGKSAAIDTIWQQRATLFERFSRENDKVDILSELPWIGPVTRHHLAKNLGADTAKPDVHLERLARRDKTTTQTLCRRLARQTGYRIATIDSILWRACADGLLNSRRYEAEGWKAAFRPAVLETIKVDVTDGPERKGGSDPPLPEAKTSVDGSRNGVANHAQQNDFDDAAIAAANMAS